MASNHRQAEETRIRRVLQINSYNFEAFERYLLEEGHVPDSTDEQAIKDAVFNLRKLFDGNVAAFPSGSPHRCLAHVFMAGENEYGDDAHGDIQKLESESSRYNAVRDLISMLAARKAQTLVAQKQQSSRGINAGVKAEAQPSAQPQHPRQLTRIERCAHLGKKCVFGSHAVDER